MEIISGVIEIAYAKEIPADQFGNTFRHSIKVGEDWISLGSGKDDRINVKEGEGWHQLVKGDVVDCVVERKGQWVNGKKTQIKVKEKSGNAPYSASAPASSPANSGGGNGGGGTQGVKVGHAITNAVTLVAHGKGESIHEEACKILRLSERLNAEYKDIVAKPATTQSASQPADDDDIPF